MTDTEQLEISITAGFFYSRSEADGIVIITNRPELIQYQYFNDMPIYIVCNPLRISALRKEFSSLLPDVKFITPNACGKKFLETKLLVCFDYLEYESRFSILRSRQLQRAVKRSLLSIVTWTASSENSSSAQQPYKAGYGLLGYAKKFSSSPEKEQCVAIGGKLLDIHRARVPLLPVLAVMHVYNEQDILAASVHHLLDQGVDVHIIDNWSTDTTYELVRSLAKQSSRVTYERFPKKPGNTFELGKILERVTDVAKEKKDYSWVMLNDADEIRWSPWQGISLQEAFSFIDSLGYNAVDYTIFNFSPTKEGFDQKHDPLTFFKYGEFSGMEGHFVQVKTWQNNPKAELAPSGGHHVAFPNQKIFPLKFFLGHYPIRSTRHGVEKIFKNRQSRFTEAEKQKGWHVQYNDISEKTSFIKNEDDLIRFGTEKFWGDFILERLSGVGIKRD
jgi:glycosyltransferase involved in cell wall biosynthesis